MDTQDNEAFNKSLNNVFSDLDQTIPFFEPKEGCRWYIGRKLIADGWCDVYQVKTHTNTLSERLVSKLERHYLDMPLFIYTNIEIGTNGCLVARFYMLANSANTVSTKTTEVDTILSDYSEPKNTFMLTGGIMTDIKDSRLSNLLTNLDASENNFYLYLITILYKRIITEARHTDFQIGVQSSELTYLSRVFEAVQAYFLDYRSVSITITILNTDHGMLLLKISFNDAEQEINVQKTVEENIYIPTLNALNSIRTSSVKTDCVSSDELAQEKLDKAIKAIEELNWLHEQAFNNLDPLIKMQINDKINLTIGDVLTAINVDSLEKDPISNELHGIIEKLGWLFNNAHDEQLSVSIKLIINKLVVAAITRY